jgi:hypothetical protein
LATGGAGCSRLIAVSHKNDLFQTQMLMVNRLICWLLSTVFWAVRSHLHVPWIMPPRSDRLRGRGPLRACDPSLSSQNE